jgi:hypothetical protein
VCQFLHKPQSIIHRVLEDIRTENVCQFWQGFCRVFAKFGDFANCRAKFGNEFANIIWQGFCQMFAKFGNDFANICEIWQGFSTYLRIWLSEFKCQYSHGFCECMHYIASCRIPCDFFPKTKNVFTLCKCLIDCDDERSLPLSGGRRFDT